MSTKELFTESELRKANPIFSRVRATIESAFYGNNVHEVTSLAEAYHLAKEQPGIIVTDLPILHTSELGLPKGATQLVDNHGKVLGRMASARHFIGGAGEDDEALTNSLYEDLYTGRKQHFLKTTVLVGLDPRFTVKAHLMCPEDQAFNLLSYMLNFRFFDDLAEKMYKDSKAYDEGDIYFYFDPNTVDPDYPTGLALFDADHNCCAVFGLRYFGELKKGTLTLAWAMAHRHGYVACHGGEQAFHFADKKDKVFAFFGLSGSGKSTLTHADHGGKYDITVLHDDAFIISRKDGSSVALEPAYFDKTHDYPAGHHETKYYTTVMNCAVTLNENGKKVLVTEDLRNNNGRVIKSRFTSANRVEVEKEPITAVFWIMKDDSLPPIVRIDNEALAATMGLTLATKRTSAENLPEGFDMNSLVIEPFADPFRAYSVASDYQDFKELFTNCQAECYVINTDSFCGKNIPKELTMALIEDLVDEKGEWRTFDQAGKMEYLALDDYPVDLSKAEYRSKLQKRLQNRLAWVDQYNQDHPEAELPDECRACLDDLVEEFS